MKTEAIRDNRHIKESAKIMNNYAMYHSLYSMSDVIGRYPEGQELANEFKMLAEQISSQIYRVAVIGEFKRGKSSLVNTLLGTEILPTDILPTTAVINRIVYDNEQKIIIYYKNGASEISSIESLSEYATKLDAEKERFAETIREIEVHFPFVLGQQHLELIDTPGLNDNEKMTSTTIEVLDRIDTAIVVISATMPLSETEQGLICQLIEQKDIYHLTFVITFIDRVSDDREDQDRVIDLITRRIEENTYQFFCKTHEQDTELKEKARKILTAPKIFAVSSKLAMQGFIKGNNVLIEQSRFNHFKLQLMALLTANQEYDLHSKAQRLADAAEESINKWYLNEIKYIDNEVEKKESRRKRLTEEHPVWQSELIEKLADMDEIISGMGISSDSNNINKIEAATDLSAIFISNLKEINASNYNVKNLIDMIGRTEVRCKKRMLEYTEGIKRRINEQMDKIEEYVLRRSDFYGIHTDLRENLSSWRSNTDFPEFDLSREHIIGCIDNIMNELMPGFEKAKRKALRRFQSKIAEYTASWRVIIIQNGKKEIELIDEMLYGDYFDTDDILRRRAEAEQRYEKDSFEAKKMKASL